MKKSNLVEDGLSTELFDVVNVGTRQALIKEAMETLRDGEALSKEQRNSLMHVKAYNNASTLKQATAVLNANYIQERNAHRGTLICALIIFALTSVLGLVTIVGALLGKIVLPLELWFEPIMYFVVTIVGSFAAGAYSFIKIDKLRKEKDL